MATKLETLNSKVKKFASESGYGDDLGKGLEVYAARLLGRAEAVRSNVLSGDDWQLADVSQFLCGNSGDGNIDGVLYSAESERVIAFQSKYRSKKWQEADLLAEIDKLAGAFERIQDKTYRRTKLSERALDLIEDSGLHLERKSISLHLVTNQPIGEMRQCFNHCKTITKSYEAKGRDVSIEVMGAAELLQYEETFEAAEYGNSVKEVQLKFNQNTFEYSTNERRAVVGMLKGNTIAALFAQHRDALFNLNVRGYLGGNSINKGIIATAEGDDAENFFYYNNGITATCSKLTDEGRNSYIANDLQIVNGAQTVRSLHKALKDDPKEAVFVLFRLIETGETNRNKSKFANSIARFQNTQNKVLDSDFFANDKIQIWIEDNFAPTWSGKGKDSFIEKFNYVRKRGMGTRGAGKEISIQEMGKLRHALLHGPKVAYREARRIWSADDNSCYAEAFGRKDENGDYQIVDEWTNQELTEMAWAVHTWIHVQKTARQLFTESRVREKSSDSSASESNSQNVHRKVPEENYLRNLSFWVVAATHVALKAAIAAGNVKGFEQIMRSQDEWKAATLPYLKEARVILSREITSLYEAGQANPRLNLPGNDNIWRKTVAEMDTRGSIRD